MNSNPKGLIVVSGASSGIGRAMSETLLTAGYSVLGIAKDFPAEKIEHDKFKSAVIDFSDLDKLPEEIEQLIRSIDTPIRGLVNNAGIGRMAFLEQLSVSDMRLVMETNFLSHAIVTKAFLPTLKQQKKLVDVVFTGSEAALTGSKQGSIYCASKFAVRGFVQAIRDECAKSMLRLSIVNPGAVRTPFFDDLHFEPGGAPENAIDPKDVAEVLLTVLNTRPGTVIDEINMSPQTHVWQRK
jgi:3-hydroxy acid dehydrogenase / malonic semialdehyde reductase